MMLDFMAVFDSNFLKRYCNFSPDIVKLVGENSKNGIKTHIRYANDET